MDKYDNDQPIFIEPLKYFDKNSSILKEDYIKIQNQQNKCNITHGADFLNNNPKILQQHRITKNKRFLKLMNSIRTKAQKSKNQEQSQQNNRKDENHSMEGAMALSSIVSNDFSLISNFAKTQYIKSGEKQLTKLKSSQNESLEYFFTKIPTLSERLNKNNQKEKLKFHLTKLLGNNLTNKYYLMDFLQQKQKEQKQEQHQEQKIIHKILNKHQEISRREKDIQFMRKIVTSNTKMSSGSINMRKKKEVDKLMKEYKEHQDVSRIVNLGDNDLQEEINKIYEDFSFDQMSKSLQTMLYQKKKESIKKMNQSNLQIIPENQMLSLSQNVFKNRSKTMNLVNQSQTLESFGHIPYKKLKSIINMSSSMVEDEGTTTKEEKKQIFQGQENQENYSHFTQRKQSLNLSSKKKSLQILPPQESNSYFKKSNIIPGYATASAHQHFQSLDQNKKQFIYKYQNFIDKCDTYSQQNLSLKKTLLKGQKNNKKQYNRLYDHILDIRKPQNSQDDKNQ